MAYDIIRMKETAAIALSGGVDSLVAGHIIKSAYTNVIGLHFITGFENHDPENLKFISDQLDIPLYTVDLSQEFKKIVVHSFVATYLSGKTPNPCMICNPAIKFGLLFNHAEKFGARFLATGHYARILENEMGVPMLCKGLDTLKDQSYFLARLSTNHLSRTLFPLGALVKSRVKEMAAAAGLVPVHQSESQDVCFIQSRKYQDFLEEMGVKGTPGYITDTDGNVIGNHEGLFRYTVGQRRGINCPAEFPYYVVRLDVPNNRLIVGFKDKVFTENCLVGDLVWHETPVRYPFIASVKLRYRHNAVSADITQADAGKLKVWFHTPQAAVTPGQGAVFYDGDKVLGAGWIES